MHFNDWFPKVASFQIRLIGQKIGWLAVAHSNAGSMAAASSANEEVNTALRG